MCLFAFVCVLVCHYLYEIMVKFLMLDVGSWCGVHMCSLITDMFPSERFTRSKDRSSKWHSLTQKQSRRRSVEAWAAGRSCFVLSGTGSGTLTRCSASVLFRWLSQSSMWFSMLQYGLVDLEKSLSYSFILGKSGCFILPALVERHWHQTYGSQGWATEIIGQVWFGKLDENLDIL